MRFLEGTIPLSLWNREEHGKCGEKDMAKQFCTLGFYSHSELMCFRENVTRMSPG